MKPEAEATIPFEVTEVDVVSSKNRTWNAKHPGNIFYMDLVQSLMASLPSNTGDIIGEMREMREMAERIVHTVTVERGGRFLKPPDGDGNPTMCIAMDKKQAVAKVLHALRTAQSKQAKLATGPSPVGPTKKTKPTTVKGEKKSMMNGEKKPTVKGEKKPITVKGDKQTTTPLSRPKATRRREATFQYQIEASPSTPIPQHTCQLIEAVCNQLVPATAHRILDAPLVTEQALSHSETAEERAHRLHFRLRFAGAAAVDMAPLEFAGKLLKLWNAKLVLVKKEPPNLERDSPLERASSTGRNLSRASIVPSRLNATTPIDSSGAFSTSHMVAASAVQWPTTVLKPLSPVNTWNTQFPTVLLPSNDVSGVSTPRLLCTTAPVPNTLSNRPPFAAGVEHPINTQATTENVWTR